MRLFRVTHCLYCSVGTDIKIHVSVMHAHPHKMYVCIDMVANTHTHTHQDSDNIKRCPSQLLDKNNLQYYVTGHSMPARTYRRMQHAQCMEYICIYCLHKNTYNKCNHVRKTKIRCDTQHLASDI